MNWFCFYRMENWFYDSIKQKSELILRKRDKRRTIAWNCNDLKISFMWMFALEKKYRVNIKIIFGTYTLYRNLSTEIFWTCDVCVWRTSLIYVGTLQIRLMLPNLVHHMLISVEQGIGLGLLKTAYKHSRVVLKNVYEQKTATFVNLHQCRNRCDQLNKDWHRTKYRSLYSVNCKEIIIKRRKMYLNNADANRSIVKEHVMNKIHEISYNRRKMVHIPNAINFNGTI